MSIIATRSRQPWNKGKFVGQNPPLRLRDIWSIRVCAQADNLWSQGRRAFQ